uniref:Uncharacterized protein n=1 Tax=Romanomermis culicivorax TaxID=13658 RepID=A0A915JPX0_ROMCU
MLLRCVFNLPRTFIRNFTATAPSMCQATPVAETVVAEPDTTEPEGTREVLPNVEGLTEVNLEAEPATPLVDETAGERQQQIDDQSHTNSYKQRSSSVRKLGNSYSKKTNDADPRSEKIDVAIVQMIAVDDQPSVVENPGFINLIKKTAEKTVEFTLKVLASVGSRFRKNGGFHGLAFNLVHLVGRVGCDPVVRGTDMRKIVCFSLATNKYMRDESSTEWHNIAATSTNLASYIKNNVNRGTNRYFDAKTADSLRSEFEEL